MNYRDRAEEIFAWGLKHRNDDTVSAWEMHSRGTAEVAEKIAEKCGMDSDEAYAMGLLHDIGRYKGPNTGMNHIIDGYDLLMKEGLPDLARICLTHSFNPREKVNDIELSDPRRNEFLKKYLGSVKYDDYDLLIQLADFMAGAHGVTTIERRFCSVLWRHELKNPAEDLGTLYDLKRYFDEKVKIDVYELFHDKIAKTPFEGIPGDYTKSNSGERKE